MSDKLLSRLVELLAVRIESHLEKQKRHRGSHRNETDSCSDDASPGSDGEAEESVAEESGEKDDELHQLFVSEEESERRPRARRPTTTRPARGRGKRGVRRGQSARREQVKSDHVRRKRRSAREEANARLEAKNASTKIRQSRAISRARTTEASSARANTPATPPPTQSPEESPTRVKCEKKSAQDKAEELETRFASLKLHLPAMDYSSSCFWTVIMNCSQYKLIAANNVTTFRSLIKGIPRNAKNTFPKWLHDDVVSRTQFHLYLKASKRLDSIVNVVRAESKKSGMAWPNCSWLTLSAEARDTIIARDLDELKIPVSVKQTFAQASKNQYRDLTAKLSNNLIDKYKEMNELESDEEEEDSDVEMRDADGEWVEEDEDVPPTVSSSELLEARLVALRVSQKKVISREVVLARQEPVPTETVVT